jgi:hypothetical protein
VLRQTPTEVESKKSNIKYFKRSNLNYEWK